MAGQEGIPSVYSPMGRTLDDLTYFSRAIIGMEPWRLQPLETVVEVTPPQDATSFTGLCLASQIINADGCITANSHFASFEPSDAGVRKMSTFCSLFRPVRYLYYLYTRYLKRDPIWTALIRNLRPRSAVELLQLVVRREAFRATWHAWRDTAPQQYDFILCPVNASPALPHGGMCDAVSRCGYTFLWNLLDYTAGVVLVGHINAELDRLPGSKRLKRAYRDELKRLGSDNGVARGTWMHYDAEQVEGLPTAVQIVGWRWQEEQVLGYMAAVEAALDEHSKGGKYPPLALE
ncbi:amidase signature domain-containing protein [Aspergillus insuetus]